MGFRLVLTFLWVAIFFLLAEIFVAKNGISDYLHLRELCRQTRERNQEIMDENRELSQEIRLLRNNKDYMGRMVRKRLHYVADDEVIYVFPDAGHETGE
ncbi:MAG: FtsB family cell division protein [Thermodesulfobacteriota bacterium]